MRTPPSGQICVAVMRKIKTVVSSPLRFPPGMRRTPPMTEERCAKGRENTEAPARANQTGPVHCAAGRQDLRTRIVRRGVRAVCGPSTAIPTSAAANIPLFSASLRFAVPLAEDSSARWASALKHAVHRLEGRNGSKHL
jgi:hypothetical protein